MYDKSGSIWRKWDLHIHTPASFHWKGSNRFSEMSQKEENVSLERIIKTFEESDVAVFGIMDYWTFDGYLKIRDYLVAERKEIETTIFPGIELRIEAAVDFRLNIHAILSNKLSNQQLIDFKQSLKIKNINRSLSDEALIQFARTLDTSKAKKHGFGAEYKTNDSVALKLGSMTAEITRESFREAFNVIPEESGFVIMPYDTSDGLMQLRWENHPAEDNFFMQLADIFETRDSKNIDLFNGKRTDENEEFIENFQTTMNAKAKPAISGSDAHSISDYGKYPSEKITWIKADTEFEGLKQILFEPELRVRIQKEHPELSEKKIHITKFSLSNNTDFPIIEQEIDINRDLVSIIGGRGSGKSAFIETIAFCFNKHKSILDNEDADEWSKLTSENDPFIDYYLKKEADFLIELNFMSLDNEPLDSFKTTFQEKNENCSYPILYLGQNRIEYFANDSDRIHALAYNTVIKNSSRSDELNQFERAIDEKREKLINLNKKIEGFNEKIKEFNEAELLDEKRRIKSEKELLTSKEVKGIIETFNVSRKKREVLKNLEELVGVIDPDNDDENESSIIKVVNDFLANITEPLTMANELAKEIGYDGPELSIDLEEFFKSIDNMKESIPKERLVKSYKDSLASVEENLKGKTDVSVSYLESLRSKETIIEEKISNLERLKDDREEKVLERYLVLDELELTYSVYNAEYQKAIDEFSERNEGILKSIRLESKREFGFRELVEKIYKEVDRRKVKSISKLVLEYLKLDSKENFRFTDWIKEFKQDEANLDIFTDKSPELFDSLVFEDYYNLITNIEYQVSNDEYKSLNKLSLGQKGTVLLKFYLSSGNNCPILIDQPEDHLDNDFIYSDLVETIRNAKKKRQIIIVTHDANIVVNGDSEQVIIARYRDERIDHGLSGSLENPRIRKAVARILEGGDEAFKKREQKYSFI